MSKEELELIASDPDSQEEPPEHDEEQELFYELLQEMRLR